MPGEVRGPDVRCRVALVDDDLMLRRALHQIASREAYVVSLFASGDEFLRATEREVPDVLVLNLHLADTDGMSVLHALLERGTEVSTIVVSHHPNVRESVQALRGGAIDFLEKPCADEALAAALRRAARLSAETRRQRIALQEIARRARALTRRERQVFELVVTGRPNKQIASVLGTSEKTVKVHRAHVMSKMHAESLADLVRMFDVLAAHGVPLDRSVADDATDRSAVRGRADASPLRTGERHAQGEDGAAPGPG